MRVSIAAPARFVVSASLTDKEVKKLRDDTPGVKKGVKHFNNAGCSLPPKPVLDAGLKMLTREAELGGYEAAEETALQLLRVYGSLGSLLKCSPDDVAVVPSATIGWQQAFYGVAAGFKEGDRILTCSTEYGSNYMSYLQAAKRTGCVVEVIPEDAEGQVDVAALEGMVDARTKLIAISHVPTSTGIVQPAIAVGRVARAAGVPYLLDACQSAGQMPLDVSILGCDFLTGTSRKYLRGPRGAGFVYVSPSAIAGGFEPGAIDVRGATWDGEGSYTLAPGARCMESYEMSKAAVLGMGAAVEYALGVGVAAGYERIQMLAGRLRGLLATIEGVEVQDRGREQCGIVSFTKSTVQPEVLAANLIAMKIHVSVSKVTSTRLDLGGREPPLEAVVRASVHYYNNEEEIMALARAIGSM